jgi:hypothetical protein
MGPSTSSSSAVRADAVVAVPSPNKIAVAANNAAAIRLPVKKSIPNNRPLHQACYARDERWFKQSV